MEVKLFIGVALIHELALVVLEPDDSVIEVEQIIVFDSFLFRSVLQHFILFPFVNVDYGKDIKGER